MCVYTLSPFMSFQLCNPVDWSPPDSSVHGILQARKLEWVAVPSSRGSSWCRDQIHISCVFSIADIFFTAEPPGKPRSKLDLDIAEIENTAQKAAQKTWFFGGLDLNPNGDGVEVGACRNS